VNHGILSAYDRATTAIGSDGGVDALRTRRQQTGKRPKLTDEQQIAQFKAEWEAVTRGRTRKDARSSG
jgi:hypothetical protein